MEEQTLKLEELAQHAGVSPRTVRYYVQRGLLPAPVFRGRDTSYGSEHLLRLKAIRRLQDRHLPLDEIQALLDTTTVEKLEALGSEPIPVQPPQLVAPRSRVEELGASTWRRLVLAPGLELHVSEQADESVRALAKALEERAKGHRGPKGAGR